MRTIATMILMMSLSLATGCAVEDEANWSDVPEGDALPDDADEEVASPHDDLEDGAPDALFHHQPVGLPWLQIEQIGCQGLTPIFNVAWHELSGPQAERWEVDVRKGSSSTWEALYRGTAEFVVYYGASGRVDRFRVRACGHHCGEYRELSKSGRCPFDAQ